MLDRPIKNYILLSASSILPSGLFKKEDILTKKLSHTGFNASLTSLDVSVDIHQLLIFWNQIPKHIHFNPAVVCII